MFVNILKAPYKAYSLFVNVFNLLNEYWLKPPLAFAASTGLYHLCIK